MICRNFPRKGGVVGYSLQAGMGEKSGTVHLMRFTDARDSVSIKIRCRKHTTQ